ncbi:hypothetical protein B4113_2951 [Geobacillus sp. B4113_201601]|nr:hypothetical protein B4113_2951 [Geobacillus sp. B4113_201601]
MQNLHLLVLRNWDFVHISKVMDFTAANRAAKPNLFYTMAPRNTK